MVEIGNNKVGIFCAKENGTFKEYGSDFLLENKPGNDFWEYACTFTENVILMLDKDNIILDMDDVPTNEAVETYGNRFIGFVKNKDENVFAFVASGDVLESANIECDKDGAIRYFSVICNDFELIADVVFSNVSKQEFNENDVVVVLSDTGVEMGKETKKVHIPFAKIELLKMQW